MSCGRCRVAINEEVSAVPGVEAVNVHLDAKRVTVAGVADALPARAAIDEAG